MKISKDQIIWNNVRKVAKTCPEWILPYVIRQAKQHVRRCIMPNRDGTGPNGKGPKTGKGTGTCKPKTPKGK